MINTLITQTTPIYRLDLCCLRVEPGIRFESLVFSFGGGMDVEQLVGDPDGNRFYKVSAQALPDTQDSRVGVSKDPQTGEETFTTPLGNYTRARYLWELFKLKKRDPSIGLYLRCPIEHVDVSVRFPSNEMSYSFFAHRFWSVGIEVAQEKTDNLRIEKVTTENPRLI